MKQNLIETSRDWLSMLLAGIGITVAPHVFFGGLILSLAVGSVIGRKRQQESHFISVLITSGLAAIIALIAAQVWNFWGWPPQLIMMLAAAVSGWVVNIFVKIMDRTEAQSGLIADRLLDRYLPHKNKDSQQ